MSPEEHASVKAAHAHAVKLPPAERRSYLDSRFPGQPELLAASMQLLKWHEQSGSFLETALAERLLETSGRPFGLSRVGPWEMIRELGRGSSATVYLARRADDLFEKSVAVKVLDRLSHSEEGFRRFRREIQLLSALEHPHIVRLLEAGITGEGVAYIVTEFVDGKRIDEHAAALSLREKLALFGKVCKAVSAAHQALIVHRDIKPSNILITADGNPKLLDFGIAFPLDQDLRLTETGMERMTTHYASPEQIRRDRTITTASDVYSLGVVLYEMIAGRSPYASQPHELASHILFQDAVPIPEAPREVEAIIRKAMHKHPQERYVTVDAFQADILRYLDGFPVLAQGGGALYRWHKVLAKHWVPIGLTAGVILALGALAYSLSVSAREARRQSSRVKELISDVLNQAVYPAGSWAPLRFRERLEDTRIHYLERLLQEYPNDPEIALQLHLAFGRLGDAQGLPSGVNLGRTAAARDTFQRDVDLTERLIVRWPGDSHLLEAAESHMELGAVQMELGLTAEANRHFARSAELTRSFAPAKGSIIEAQAQMSRILVLEGRSGEALESRRQIVATRRTFFQSDPGTYRWALAGSLCSYGELLRETGDLRRAQTAYAEALPLIDDLVQTIPANLGYHWHLARENEEYGKVMAALHDSATARKHYERAIATYREIARQEPDSVSNRRSLAVCLSQLAELDSAEGNRAAALARLTEALALSRAAAAQDTASVKARKEADRIAVQFDRANVNYR